MAIETTTQTITTITCDMCRGKVDNEEDLKIHIPITTFYTDIQAYVYGQLRLYADYQTSNGVLCPKCQLKVLKKHVKKLEEMVKDEN